MSDTVTNIRKVALEIKEQVENLRVRSKFYDSDMIIKESYCSNPKCNCRDVTLKFFKVDEDNNEGDLLFSVKLSLDTFDILDRNVYDKSVRYEKIIGELLEDLSDEIKLRFNTNYNIAKGIDNEKVTANISQRVKDFTLEGNCVAYVEVFETSKSILFKDDKNNLIYVEDLHCMNPKCPCNEVFLSFIEVNEKESTEVNIFTIRYSLKNGKYELEDQYCTEERMKDVLKYFKREEKQIHENLKQRYKAMKEVGEEIFRGSKEAAKAEPVTVKVGRNDACPCGSGKKYKKCCGK